MCECVNGSIPEKEGDGKREMERERERERDKEKILRIKIEWGRWINIGRWF